MIVEKVENLKKRDILFIGTPDNRVIMDAIDESSHQINLITTDNEEEALDWIRRGHPDLVLIDYDLKNIKPIPFLEKLSRFRNGHTLLGLTQQAPLNVVLKTIKLGVKDVIHVKQEPFKVHQAIKKLMEQSAKVEPEVKNLYDKQRAQYDFQHILNYSPSLENVFSTISRIITKKWVTIMITGETGTGKGLVARAVHYNSFADQRPFVEINCNALPENLLESELFGHEKGAFTDAKTQKKGLFELANEGTLFLDEIGDVPVSVQTKLLKAIEDKSIRRVGGTEDIRVNSRIIAATNRNLQQLIKEGAFRIDLYYRLNVVSLHLPPLRSRKYDIVLLANKFLEFYAREYDSPVKSFTPQALALLKEYPWPGNVRELKHAIERMVLLTDSEKLDESVLQDALQSEMNKIDLGSVPSNYGSIVIPPEGISLEEGERLIIQTILERANWNKRQACRMLQISRPTLDRKIEKYNLAPK